MMKAWVLIVWVLINPQDKRMQAMIVNDYDDRGYCLMEGQRLLQTWYDFGNVKSFTCKPKDDSLVKHLTEKGI